MRKDKDSLLLGIAGGGGRTACVRSDKATFVGMYAGATQEDPLAVFGAGGQRCRRLDDEAAHHTPITACTGALDIEDTLAVADRLNLVYLRKKARGNIGVGNNDVQGCVRPGRERVRAASGLRITVDRYRVEDWRQDG